MPRIVFRSTFNRVLSIIAWAVLGAVAVGTVVTPGALNAVPAVILSTASIAALVWAVLWAPYVAVDDEVAEVGNVLLEYRVPWAALIHVETRYALLLHTPGRRISATAAPAPGALSGVRSARAHRRSEGAATPGTRPGDLPTTDSGRAAGLVRDRWYELRDAGRIEGGAADGTPVQIRPRLASIVAIALAVAGLAATALLI